MKRKATRGFFRGWRLPPGVVEASNEIWSPGQHQSDGFYRFKAPPRCVMPVPCGVCWYCQQARSTLEAG